MADPLSIVAAAAALGGFSGKLAEKTWDSASKWLRQKFGSHSAEARQQATKNAANFVSQLAIQVNVLEKNHEIEPEKIAQNQRHPQFSALLQESIISASQTDSEEKHSLLARLVANRLSASSESTLSLASQLASKAISLSTSNQLLLLGLCCLLEDIRPSGIRLLSDYRSWIQIHFEPFGDFEFKEHDVKHLIALNCVTYDPSSERSLELLLQMKAGIKFVGKPLRLIMADLELLKFNWDIGLAGVSLTSVGSIIGSLVLTQITGFDHGLPKWK